MVRTGYSYGDFSLPQIPWYKGLTTPRYSYATLEIAQTEQGGTMTCIRCQGLMVTDQCDDIFEGIHTLHTPTWRCIGCGDIIDSVILQNRKMQAHLLQEDAPLTSIVEEIVGEWAA